MTEHKLEIVKARGGKGEPLPGSQALKDGVSLCTSVESAQYMYDQCKVCFKKAGVLEKEAFQQIMTVLKELIEYRKLGDIGSDVWSGQPATSEFQNVQFRMASDFFNKMDTSKPITFDFAVGDKAQLIGVFTAEGQPLDDSTETGLNKQLIAWLGKNQLINDEGVVYAATESGKIKQQDGKPVTADPEALKEDLLDKKTGLAPYVQQNNKSMQLTIYPHDYVEPAAKNAPQDSNSARGA